MTTSTMFQSGPARDGDSVLLVEFTPGGKGYSYLASQSVPVGTTVFVATPVQPEPVPVTVLDRKWAGPLNRGKRIIEHANGHRVENLWAAKKILSHTLTQHATVDEAGYCKGPGDYVLSVRFKNSPKEYSYFARLNSYDPPTVVYVLTPRRTIEQVRVGFARPATPNDRFKRVIENPDGAPAGTFANANRALTAWAKGRVKTIDEAPSSAAWEYNPQVSHYTSGLALEMYAALKKNLSSTHDDVLDPIKNGTYAEFARTLFRPSLINKEPKDMIDIKTITYVNNTNIRDLSNDAVMNLIANANERIAQLENTNPRPTRINKEIEKLRGGVQQLVKLLDDIDADGEKPAASPAE